MKPRIWTLTLAALCLLAGPLLAAAAPLWLDLGGPWRMRDDAGRTGVRTVPLPGREHLFTGDRIIRLDRDVEIPADANTSKMVLTLGSVSEAYEVRINGQQIARVGEFNLATPKYSRPRSFPVPDGLLQPGSTAHIELRVFRASYSGRRYTGVIAAPDEGPYILTSAELAPRNVAAENSRIRENAASLGVASACLGLALAALLLIVWLDHRRNTAIPLLAGFLICEELARLIDAAVIFADWPVAIDNLAYVWISVGIALCVLFAAHIAGVRSRWITAASWLPVVIRVVHMWSWWTTQGHVPPLLIEVWRQSVQWTYLLAAWIALWPVLRQFRTGRRQLAELAVPLLTAAMGLSASVRLRQEQLLIIIAGYRLQIFEIASLLIAAILAWLLLRELTAERARFSSELEAGRTVQQLLFSGGETTAGVEAVWRPATEVGGDFWQAIPLGDGSSRLIIVGDVSGKGLKAAMVVSLVTGAIRNRHSDQPAALLTELNKMLDGTLDGGFVTACVARIDADGHATIANAGHPSPYLDGSELDLPAGLPLGLAADSEYIETTIQLTGTLTFLSDGVVEAANEKGELFGFDRTREISTRSATEIAEAAKAWGQTDDITVLTVRRTPA